MPARSPSRGRSRSRSRTPLPTECVASPRHGKPSSRSPHRSASPRYRSQSQTPPAQNEAIAKPISSGSVSRSRSPSRGDGRSYRERSYSRDPSRVRGVQSSKIVVEKLTKNVTEAHLREIFGTYGQIDSIDLPLHRQFMTNRGSAYILYDHPNGSESAIAHMHEAQLDGVVISVSIVLPRRAFSRSPPPAKSGRGGQYPIRNGPPSRGPPSNRYRSPPSRRGGFAGSRRGTEDNSYIPRRNYSRSASPHRRPRRSASRSRSRSPTPVRRRGPPARSPPRRRRRSPSYSSYSSYSRSRSRTRSRSRSRDRYGGRR